ncbi:hypothetical protein DLEV_090 [Diachasmimorpha longicaudata entomopoxvirus]|uniref:Uncharacterized protein n=1 Tax=Diachasmimorpha longicaudata entomopoxvirus TaxID=109981 RepID=A0A7R5WK31_9POXV|nr:hypothetical protein QKK69_gp090 [Diachasmimorpha longicaudata entomopoxvirus]AKS26381.1 hypothetical protein DLEV_090 [Diachasmimorpha longicaudata entomopoxvirus]
MSMSIAAKIYQKNDTYYTLYIWDDEEHGLWYQILDGVQLFYIEPPCGTHTDDWKPLPELHKDYRCEWGLFGLSEQLIDNIRSRSQYQKHSNKQKVSKDKGADYYFFNYFS